MASAATAPVQYAQPGQYLASAAPYQVAAGAPVVLHQPVTYMAQHPGEVAYDPAQPVQYYHVPAAAAAPQYTIHGLPQEGAEGAQLQYAQAYAAPPQAYHAAPQVVYAHPDQPGAYLAHDQPLFVDQQGITYAAAAPQGYQFLPQGYQLAGEPGLAAPTVETTAATTTAPAPVMYQAAEPQLVYHQPVVYAHDVQGAALQTAPSMIAVPGQPSIYQPFQFHAGAAAPGVVTVQAPAAPTVPTPTLAPGVEHSAAPVPGKKTSGKKKTTKSGCCA